MIATQIKMTLTAAAIMATVITVITTASMDPMGAMGLMVTMGPIMVTAAITVVVVPPHGRNSPNRAAASRPQAICNRQAVYN